MWWCELKKVKSELCVGGVAVEDGKILLVRRAHRPAAGYWSIPGGRVENGETLEEAVKREMLEECGVEVEVGDVVCVAEVIRDEKHYVIVDFYVKLSGNVEAGGDAVEARWFDMEEASRREDVVDSARELLRIMLECRDGKCRDGGGKKCPYIKEFYE